MNLLALDGKIFKAAIFAAVAHKTQTRNYNGNPYITHPIDVAHKVAKIVYDMHLPESLKIDMICAAMNHDVLEDCDYTYADISAEFGYVVADLVKDLTNTSKQYKELSRAQRKKMDAEKLLDKSQEVHIIKYADIMSNTSVIMKEDPVFGAKYVKEKLELVPYLNNLPEELKEDLLTHLRKLLKEHYDSTNQ